MLSFRRFKVMVVGKIRSNILTEGESRALVKVVNEAMDGVAREQHQTLETVQSELAEVRRRLDRLYNLVETIDLDMANVPFRTRDHRERKGRLEISADEARALLAERRGMLDSVDTIATFAAQMSDFLKAS